MVGFMVVGFIVVDCIVFIVVCCPPPGIDVVTVRFTVELQ